ncbi:MAG: HAMP domain-containing histidine kinase [Fibrobacter sp.]|nr:HAMP domain-containing histidine kinase [Fibrobacter sp.]
MQKEVYQKVATSSLKMAQRSVKNSLKANSKGDALTDDQSEYVTESLRFSEIISGKKSGIIPRIIDEKMMLLYWKKNTDNTITGSVINEKQLRKRLIRVLPESYTDVRILTLIDQTGHPIIPDLSSDSMNWKTPFISQEVSELLPGWEAAAYLSNPQEVRHRARTTALIIGCMIGFLLLSLIVGSIIVIRAMKEELLLAQQKTTFVANVSHELKTPLTSIRLFAELLLEKRQTDPVKQKKYLSIMVSETERLTRLINNVLDFSRTKKGEKKYRFEKTDIVALGKELIETQRDRLEHNGFIIEIEKSGESLFVNADGEAMRQVLINILSNAEKYSTENKSIFIRFVGRNGNVLIEIEDRGIGIKDSNRVKIFDEFFRVDDSLTARVNGTGLGLTISKQIVKDHGGEISCRAAQPCGTVFEIKLPLYID